MLDDAYQDRCDLLIVVSGDSDLVPAFEIIKTRFPEKQLLVYVPTRVSSRGAAVEIRGAADRNRTLPLKLLRAAQFPRQMSDGAGGTLTKPENW